MPVTMTDRLRTIRDAITTGADEQELMTDVEAALSAAEMRERDSRPRRWFSRAR